MRVGNLMRLINEDDINDEAIKLAQKEKTQVPAKIKEKRQLV